MTDDPQHGVTALARRIADAVARRTRRDLVVSPAELTGPTPPASAHLHFTDRLWASSPEDAADRLVDLAGRVALTVTLHDLPQPSDGERNLVRRGHCYRRVVEAAAGTVVNSEHEALLLAEHTTAAVRPAVVPLPVDLAAPPSERPAPDGTAAVIGFVYPGKGHAELVDAVARLRGRGDDPAGALRVVALGRASAGHEAETDQLVADAASRAVVLDVTGYLDDAVLLDRCRRASVPVAVHRHVSASGSIATWIGAGRRPIVPDTRYSREMAALRPGTLTLIDDDPDALVDAVARAAADPDSTWLAPDAVTTPGIDDVAAAYLEWWAGRERSGATS
ncbi:glycosyltransferase family 4 protein [Frigoribacterium sp. ACAM 257]|uniref:glycosyltransferase family 4 protein n=1 Tax=Frigoribacterium sp. ACAM 257 TaxID=2508998 RepID=UPI0011B99A9F|nr:glycosyltransferase family 4 protein [Frigoribacterium sp. ACAM 257]TWX40661.1 glycosyltransferase family 4 protein [Frigoribacterium sp. ACAM 257]